MELFKIAPFDQILRVESSSGASSILLRADNVKTLGELKVLPRSLIYLRADDMAVGCDNNGTGATNGLARAGSGDGEPWSLNHHPEEGFKGELEVLTGSGGFEEETLKSWFLDEKIKNLIILFNIVYRHRTAQRILELVSARYHLNLNSRSVSL